MFDKEPLITMIVTVHNNADTLRESLESLVNQTYKNIEILCIDGGSTDASPDILTEYEKKDNRIQIIKDTNTSYGHKINRGIVEAKGEYIGILEGDDIMKPFMLERLTDIAKAYDVDYVDGDYDAFYVVKGKKRYLHIDKYSVLESYDKVLDKEDNLKLLIHATGAIWTGLYKVSFLKEHKIFMFESPGASFQDTSFRFLVNLHADSAYHIKEAVHDYRMDNPNSSIRSQEKIFCIAKEYEFLREQLIERGVDENIWKIFYKWKYEGYFWNTFRLNESIRDEFVKFYKEEIIRDSQEGNVCLEHKEIQEHLIINNPNEFEKRIKDKAERGNLNVNYLTQMVERLDSKQCMIFGSGITATQLFRTLHDADIEIIGVCDNNPQKQGTMWNGERIISVEEAVRDHQNVTFVIPKGKYASEMKAQLQQMKVDECNIFISR